MAAPTGIVWGSVVNSKGRVGIYANVTTTDTEATVSIEVWFYSKWSVTDSLNSYYFNNEATYATTKIGSVNIKHTVSSGNGWSNSNQTKLGSYSYTYPRGNTDRRIYCAAKLATIEAIDGTMSASTSYVIPAIKTYTISYDAKGGTGAPSSQTKYHGTDILVPTNKPTRTGYIFKGWSTSSSATEVTHQPGKWFGIDADTTLYAVWQRIAFTISYDANGGTGTISSHSAYYNQPTVLEFGEALLSRTDYRFVGWGTSPNSTTVAYYSGASYLAKADVTFYAIWEYSYTRPRITELAVYRCDSSGVESDEGLYFNIHFGWETDHDVSSVTINWKRSGQNGVSHTVSANGTSGSVDTTLGNGEVLTDFVYDVSVTVADTSGRSVASVILPGAMYTIDCLAGGRGVAIGKAAETENLFEVAWLARVNSNLEVLGDIDALEGTGRFYEFRAAKGTVGTVNTTTTFRDKFDLDLTNGLCKYTSEGIDPNDTLEHLILTHINTPNGGYMYIKTEFYNTKSTSANRMQTAFPYYQNNPPYYRYYYDGFWSGWMMMKSTNYVSSERLTGDIWIDGKPIYRRVLQFSVNTTGSMVEAVTISDYSQMIKMDGYIIRPASGSHFPLTFYYSSSNYHSVWMDEKGIILVKTSAACDCTVILEYTKTTD